MVLDELVAVVRWDTDPKGLAKTRRGVLSMKREVTGAVSTLGSLRRALIEAFAARAVFHGTQRLIGGIVATNARFEQLRAQLHTVTGSSEKAAEAFNMILKFAKDTPFTVDKITEAYSTFRTVGIVPTERLLMSFANTAAGMGRDISDFAVAVRGAVTGEMEALKSFGITARVEGEMLAITFGDQTRRIARNKSDLIALLQEIGETQYAGGAARQMATLVGMMSNIQDSADQLAMKIGEQGLNGRLKEMGHAILDLLDNSEGLAEGIGEGLNTAAEVLLEQLESLLEWTQNLKAEDVRDFIKDVVTVMRTLLSIGGKVLGFVRDLATGSGVASTAVRALGYAFVGMKLAQFAQGLMQVVVQTKAVGLAASFALGPWGLIAATLGALIPVLASVAGGFLDVERAQKRGAPQLPGKTEKVYGEEAQEEARAASAKVASIEGQISVVKGLRISRAERRVRLDELYAKKIQARQREARARAKSKRFLKEQAVGTERVEALSEEAGTLFMEEGDVRRQLGETEEKLKRTRSAAERQGLKRLKKTLEAKAAAFGQGRAGLGERAWGLAEKDIPGARELFEKFEAPARAEEAADWYEYEGGKFSKGQRARYAHEYQMARQEDLGHAEALSLAKQSIQRQGPKKKGKKKKEEVTEYQKKVRAALGGMEEKVEFAEEEKLMRMEWFRQHPEALKRRLKERVAERMHPVQQRIAAGDLSVLGGEFSQSSRLMREAGLIDQAARAAPPVIAMSVVRIGDIHVQVGGVRVDKANATAQEIASTFDQQFDEKFKQKIKAAILPHMPTVVR